MPRKSSSHQRNEVVLGGQTIVIKPLMAVEGIRLCLLLGPYLPKLFKAAEALIQRGDPDERVNLLRELANAMGTFPGDLMRMVGIVVDRRPEWVAQNATAEEVLAALVVIAEIIDLNRVVTVGAQLGLIRFEEADDARRHRVTRNLERGD